MDILISSLINSEQYLIPSILNIGNSHNSGIYLNHTFLEFFPFWQIQNRHFNNYVNFKLWELSNFGKRNNTFLELSPVSEYSVILKKDFNYGNFETSKTLIIWVFT